MLISRTCFSIGVDVAGTKPAEIVCIRESIFKNSNLTEVQEKIALVIKQLPIPTLTYLKKENMWTKNYRYYSTNPNGACGYILSYQLQERLPTKLPLSIDLYQPSTRNKFISFLNYQKSHINTLQFNHHIEKKEEISLRISEMVKWVTSSFQSNTNRIPPYLPQSHWFSDTFFPYLKLQNPFTYFNTSPEYTGYLKAMYTSSIPEQHLIYTYDHIISFMKDSQVQYDTSHFFFLDDPNPTKDLQAFNEAVHNLSSNIYKFFSTTPSAINSTIKHIPTTIDLITPIHTPPLSPRPAAVDMETIVHCSIPHRKCTTKN